MNQRVVLMRGSIRLAALLGFFESLSWIIAASLVFANLGDPPRAIAFAAGFGTGVLVGGLVELVHCMSHLLLERRRTSSGSHSCTCLLASK